MKKLVFLILFLLSALISEESDSVSGSAFIGATTIDGKNYQQIGFRADIPIGKLGIGVDAKISIDSDGNLRDEDWDDFEDYLNLIYYLRWAHKKDPFYLKVGSLSNVKIGYGIAMNGYSNMVRYPEYKMIGVESAFNLDRLSGEFFVNNIKELFEDKSSAIVAGRLGYKVLGDLTIGGTIAADLNEYNGLLDSDDDGYPDRIDKYPDNNKFVTEIEYLRSKGATEETIENLIEIGELDPTEREQMFSKDNQSSEVVLFGADISYPLFRNKIVALDIYGEFAKIKDYGWGFTAPGINANFGPINIYAEYRQSSEEFLFSYFNNTYEIERATYQNNGDGLVIQTKSDKLDFVPEMKGYFLGADFDLFGVVNFYSGYQDLRNSDINNRSLEARLALNNSLIPKLSKAMAYYVQNNVEDFDEIKTPSTVYGAIIGYSIGEGVSLDFNWRTTFDDINGNGKIDGRDEENRSYGVGASISF